MLLKARGNGFIFFCVIGIQCVAVKIDFRHQSLLKQEIEFFVKDVERGIDKGALIHDDFLRLMCGFFQFIQTIPFSKGNQLIAGFDFLACRRVENHFALF